MNTSEIFAKVDHTLLKAVSSWEGIQALCRQAIQYGMASVCIPPCYVARVKKQFGEQLRICTVIGFPLGYSTTAVKVFEAADAVKNGADEIDMVVNLTDVKNGLFEDVTAEISAIRQAVPKAVLKVIIETCYLTEEEKIALCRCVTEAGADYIKTSTGFGTGGATLGDYALLRRHIGEQVKVKCAGGIRSREEFERFYEAGCDRIGASAAVDALADSD